MSDTLLTVSEVAKHLRLSNMSVYREIKRGNLAALRVGKSYRVRASDLAEYLKASEVSA